jgi:prepilin-type N-terminal cleavage/methylation domain-containing protein
MRRGYSLTELVIAMVVVSSVSIVLAGLFTTIISDIPRLCGTVQENTSVLNMLEQMHEDIDAAKDLPDSFGQYWADKNLLLIELPQGIVCYQLKDGRVLRRRLPVAGTPNGTTQEQSTGWLTPLMAEPYEEETKVWSVPNAKVEWQVRRIDSGPGHPFREDGPQDGLRHCAVEVKTCIEHHVRGCSEEKMANSYLFFSGVFRKAGQ